MESAFRHDMLQGEVAVVTGGSSGIGLAIATALAAHGATVHLVSRSQERLDMAAQAVASAAPGAEVHTHPADVRDREALRSVAQVVGPVDVLVGAAAGNFPVPFDAMSEGAWDSVVDIVLQGTANTMRAFRPLLGAGSRVVNVVAGYAWTGAPGVSHSGAAKAGVLGLTRSLAVEWAPHVRVNAVAPGPVGDTEGMRRLGDALGLRGVVEGSVPLGRMARAEEIAAAALFLVSPAASFVTGTCLVADGGQDARGPFGALWQALQDGAPGTDR